MRPVAASTLNAVIESWPRFEQRTCEPSSERWIAAALLLQSVPSGRMLRFSTNSKPSPV